MARLVTRPCVVCATPIRRLPSQFKTPEPTCGARCRGRHSRRDRRPMALTWKRGHAYVHVGTAHHLADQRGYAPRARVVAEQKLGRMLNPGEKVLRLNDDPADDRPDNLIVWSPRIAAVLLPRAVR